MNLNVQAVLESIRQIDWQHPSWDLLLIVFFLVSALLYGVSLGRDRLLVILMSVYMSLAVVKALPEAVFVVELERVFAFHVTAFLSLFVVLFFFLSRSALLRAFGNRSSQGKLWQVLILSILQVGLLISVVFTFLPDPVLSNFAPMTRAIFADQWAFFAWIIAPVLAMLVMKASKADI